MKVKEFAEWEWGLLLAAQECAEADGREKGEKGGEDYFE